MKAQDLIALLSKQKPDALVVVGDDALSLVVDGTTITLGGTTEDTVPSA